MRYAIDDGTLSIASRSAVLSALVAAYGTYSTRDLARASDAELAAVSAYRVVESYPSKADYQEYTPGNLVLSGGVVTAHWVATDIPVESARAAARAVLATIRFAKETGGVLVGGTPVATDRDSQTKLIAARINAKEDDTYTVNWKADNGSFVQINAATMIAIADAVSAHIQACFDREAVLSAAISAATTTAEVRAIDLNSGWPS
jgi:hypothetical protein